MATLRENNNTKRSLKNNYALKIYHFLLFFLPFSVLSQTKITGTITDSLGTPIPFAPIGLLALPDSNIIKGTIANDMGQYSIEHVKSGSYILKVQVIGYKEKVSQETRIDSLLTENLVVNVQINISSSTLDEISVSSIRPIIEFKNGNTIINVENSPLAKGNTVYDLLAKLPGVSIDNNSIQLKGKAGVIIMLDGRVQQLSNTQLLNMLRNMNTEVVDKIELMTNPPVKYDASGTSGMINIKTKKSTITGFSGSIYTSCSQGFYGRGMGGMALNYKAKKVALFSVLDYNYGLYQTVEKLDRRFITDLTETQFSSDNSMKDIDNSLTYKVGADWFVNKNNTIGFKIDGGPGSYISYSNGVNKILQYNDLGFDHLTARVYTPDKWTLNNYNLNAEHHFDTLGSTLNLSADYTKLSELYKSDIQNLFFNVAGGESLPANIYRSKNTNSTDIFSSKLDYNKVLHTNTSLQAGVKLGYINTANNYLFERKDNLSGNYYQDTALTNNYTYEETTYAAYVNYIKTIKNLTMQLGLRAENTQLQGHNSLKSFDLKRNYFNLFPNISLEYTLSEKQNLQLNLNRRIDRPAYNDLSPFQFYRDQYAYAEGNPFLQPHYSNNVELTHNYNQSISNTLTFTRINNVMVPYTKQNDSSKVMIETVKNMKYNNYYGYSFFIQQTIKSWWNLSSNATVSYIEFSGDINGSLFKTASLYYSPSLTNTFIGPKSTKLEISAFYNSARNNGIIQLRPRWMLSFALKKSFFKEKLDCSIGLNDIFYSYVGRTLVNFGSQNWNFRATNDTRRVIFSINYNFGKITVNERDASSNEQEKGRLNH